MERGDFQLVAHADRASQYTSAEYTQELDNAGVLADRSWRTGSQLELAVAEHVSWFNQERLHESLGDRSPGNSAPRTFGCPTPSATSGITRGGSRSGRCSGKASPSPRSPRL